MVAYIKVLSAACRADQISHRVRLPRESGGLVDDLFKAYIIH